MKYRTLSVTAIASAITASITKEDIFFIISIAVTVLNLVLEYLRSRKNDEMEKNKSSP